MENKKDVNKHKSMNIIEYIKNEMRTFEEHSINELDGLVFSQLSYLEFYSVVPDIKERKRWVSIASLYKSENFRNYVSETFAPKENQEFITLLCASPRYRDIALNYRLDKYDKKTEEQFHAITLKIPTGEYVIAIRGTDATIIGWKEDFNMAFLSPVPSQLSAVEYIDSVAKKIKFKLNKNIYLAGHSKGGNLAIYGSAFAKRKTQKNIVKIFNYDGPGFLPEILDTEGYRNINDKIFKLVPESSIVGMLLESRVDPQIVKSSTYTILQHDLFTWQIEKDHFKLCNSLSSTSSHLNKTLDNVVAQVDINQRKTIVNALFSVIDEAKTEKITDFAELGPKKTIELFSNAMKNFDEVTTKCLKDILKIFVKSSFETLFEIEGGKKNEKEMDKLIKKFSL